MNKLFKYPSRSAFSLLVASLLTALTLTSCGKGSSNSVPGLDNFHANVIKSHLYVSFISSTLHWDEGLTVPIPGIDDATVSVAPDLNSSGTVFQFSIGIAALLNHGKSLPLSGLPDNGPLPDIESGKLPRWDTAIKGLKLSLYLSDDAFGVFIPLSFVSPKGATLPLMVSLTIQDERGNILGKAYALPGVTPSGSGLFVLIPYLGGAPHANTN